MGDATRIVEKLTALGITSLDEVSAILDRPLDLDSGTIFRFTFTHSSISEFLKHLADHHPEKFRAMTALIQEIQSNSP